MKSNGAIRWEYDLDGTTIIRARYYNGNTLQKIILFAYDNNGLPHAMKVTDASSGSGKWYYYEKNLQGDIVGIMNADGYKVVSYSYDAWGVPYAPVYSTDSVVSAADKANAELNPFRYRGYYYDSETGYYYLQTRYYNPEWGRFINADFVFDDNAGILKYNKFTYCANNPVIFRDDNGESLILTCVLIGTGIGLAVGAFGGSHYAKHKKNLNSDDGWDYWKYVVIGGAGGGALGGLAGWAFSGTSVAASISWAYYKATSAIGASSYAIGRAFEKWFYKAYNVIEQQVRYMGYRFDAIYKNSIVELKNYDWSKYSNYSSLIKSFTTQAKNYMQFIGETIRGQEIKGVTFCFSSEPPQEIIGALRAIGVTVNWLN